MNVPISVLPPTTPHPIFCNKDRKCRIGMNRCAGSNVTCCCMSAVLLHVARWSDPMQAVQQTCGKVCGLHSFRPSSRSSVSLSIEGYSPSLVFFFQFQVSSVSLIREACQALQVHSQREHTYCGGSERMSTYM